MSYKPFKPKPQFVPNTKPSVEKVDVNSLPGPPQIPQIIPSATPTLSITPTISITPSITPSISETVTPTPTETMVVTPTPTETQPPSVYTFNLGYDAASSNIACSTIASNYYSYDLYLGIGSVLYTDYIYPLTNYVSAGYYSDNSVYFEVTGATGQIVLSGSCV
jgi:hypothetical protein